LTIEADRLPNDRANNPFKPTVSRPKPILMGNGPGRPGREEQGAEPDQEQCGGRPEAHASFDPGHEAQRHPDKGAASRCCQLETGGCSVERIACGDDRQGRAVAGVHRADGDEGQQAGCDGRSTEGRSGTTADCLVPGRHSRVLVCLRLVGITITVAARETPGSYGRPDHGAGLAGLGRSVRGNRSAARSG
jgi:hypothetical protein